MTLWHDGATMALSPLSRRRVVDRLRGFGRAMDDVEQPLCGLSGMEAPGKGLPRGNAHARLRGGLRLQPLLQAGG